jgi:hypothetical protein
MPAAIDESLNVNPTEIVLDLDGVTAIVRVDGVTFRVL